MERVAGYIVFAIGALVAISLLVVWGTRQRATRKERGGRRW
jgi:hypothetical protein